MNTHADKNQENKSQSVSGASSQKQSGGEATFQFVDNRPEVIAQRELQCIANNSSKVKQLMVFQEKISSQKNQKPIQLQPFDDGRSIGRDGVNREFRSTIPGRNGNQYYFRAVTPIEYNQLATTGSFARQASYQGISPTEDYAATYFGANKSHYLIEFKVDDGIDLVQEFNYAGTGQKPEAGVMSMGLGTTATPVAAGRSADGGDYFMYGLKARNIRWRLIRFIGTKPPAVWRG